MRLYAGMAIFAAALVAGAGCKSGSGGGETPSPQMSYNALCAGCHGVTGQGDAARYPPLDGHVARILNAEGGREYLKHVAAFGVEGPIDAGGKGWDGMMASVRAAPHADLARALNHVVAAWSNGGNKPEGFAPYTAQEIEALRAKDLAPHQVRRMRPALKDPGSTQP